MYNFREKGHFIELLTIQTPYVNIVFFVGMITSRDQM